MEHEHVLTTLVENRPGVLARISGLFSARGFNIDSLAVGETEDPTVSRMTIVVRGDDRILEQVTKQLNKLIDVIKVQDYSSEEFVQRELILIKVNADSKSRSEIMQIADIFRARIVDVSQKTLTLELTGDQGKIKAMIDLLKPFGLKEIARTGRIAMSRG
ncbi:MAG: acetolactate synthase small subunit [bacterium]|nr:acetolactate synthase small subunit [bacterium]